MWRRLSILMLALALLSGCKRAYDVGDKVLVEWEGEVYPAVILEIPGPGKVKVHYEGYDEMWDEAIARSKIKGRIEGNEPIPDPPEKVRRKAMEAAKTNRYKIGDRVKVQFQNHYYPAVIVGVVGPERYRVHYDGYGNEWDENVGTDRMGSK
jgi:RNA binding activity-knot of a chromodomain